MRKTMKRTLSLALVCLLLLAILPTGALAADQSPADHWAAGYIRSAVNYGWIEEGADADQAITRAEFAVILWKVLGSPNALADSPFEDVTANEAKTAITALYEHGIVSGRSDSIFAPDEVLIRQDGIRMLAQAFGLKAENPNAAASFNDWADVNASSQDAVSAAVEQGFVIGVGNNNLAPNQNMTLGEMGKLTVVIYEAVSDIISVEEASEKGFACVLTENGEIFWEVGTDSVTAIAEANNLADASTISIEVVPISDSEYPYLDMDAVWQMHVVGAIPGWFSEELQNTVWDAFAEWKDQVYSKFDCEAVLNANSATYISASPAEDYVVTEEDLANFKDFVNTFYDWAYGGGRDNIYKAMVAELGESVAYDAYQYLKNVANEVKSSANTSVLLKEMGITNVGGTQESFGDGMVGSFFNLETLDPAYSHAFELIDYFLERGMTVSDGSDDVWRLHALDGGRIVYAATASDLSTSNNAFACVVGSDGTLYWQLGLDSFDTIRSTYDLTDDDQYIDVQVMPVLDETKAEYSLPDGLNPEITRYFPYFEDVSTWTLTVRSEETPSWFTAELQNKVLAACDEWRQLVFSILDFDAATKTFPEEFKTVSTYTEEDIELLKEYVIAKNAIEAKGYTVDAVINGSIEAAVGSTIAGEMYGYMNAKWRVVHTDCAQPCTKIGYTAYLGLNSYTDPGNTLENTLTALRGSFYKNITWLYCDDPDVYPFQAAADLMNKGFVPYTDGTYWYLSAGENCDVLFAISEAELLGIDPSDAPSSGNDDGPDDGSGPPPHQWGSDNAAPDDESGDPPQQWGSDNNAPDDESGDPPQQWGSDNNAPDDESGPPPQRWGT